VLDEATLIASAASGNAQPYFQGGEGANPADQFNADPPEYNREVPPYQSWPAKNQQTAKDYKENEKKVD
jgi:hypothetical protein